MLYKIIFMGVLSIAAVCSKGNECIQGALRDVNTDTCKCESGLKGHPDLCCYHPDQNRACYLSDDSIFHTYTNTTIHSTVICGARISTSHVKGECKVEVRAGAMELKFGAMYTTKVEVVLKGQQMVSLMFGGEKDRTSMVYSLGKNSKHSMDVSRGRQHLHIMGIQGVIVIEYYNTLNLFRLEACQTTITFRVVTADENQESLPSSGVCIMTNPKATVKSDRRAMCSKDKDMSKASADEIAEYAILPIMQYTKDMISLESLTAPSLQYKCNGVANMVKHVCKGKYRMKALKKCAFLLLNPDVRRCFYEVEKRVSNILKHYNNCLRTYCIGSKKVCMATKRQTAVKTCAPSILKCDTWPVYIMKNKKRKTKKPTPEKRSSFVLSL